MIPEKNKSAADAFEEFVEDRFTYEDACIIAVFVFYFGLCAWAWFA